MPNNISTHIAYFRTSYIDSFKGYVILIGACQKQLNRDDQKAIREWVVIFPNETPKIANRIISSVEDEEYPFFDDVSGEANRLLSVAKTTLRIWTRNNFPTYQDELNEALQDGKLIGDADFKEMHYLGLLGEEFYTLHKETKIGDLSKLSRKYDQLDRANHSTEPYNSSKRS